MYREFDFFDDEVIRAEFEELPSKDAAKLIALMEHYETSGLGDPSPGKIDDYGHGLMRMRHIKSAYSGRCLFYVGSSSEGYQKLWILTVYKKESQEIPKHILDRARARKAAHQIKGKKNDMGKQ